MIESVKDTKENEKITFDDNIKKFVAGYEHLLDKEKNKEKNKDTK